jgi:hypothetical protein
MKPLVIVTMVLVAVAAFALSFQSLKTLGTLSGYGDLAWLYPVVVDLGTVSSCVTWLGTRSRQAFWMTWSLLGVSVLQNGTVHWLIATHQTPEWALITLVATVPPIVLGLTVHLGVGLGREQAAQAKTEREVAEKARERAAERQTRAAAAKVATPPLKPPSPPPVPSEIESHRGQRQVIVEWVSSQDTLPTPKVIQTRWNVSRSTATRVLADVRSA